MQQIDSEAIWKSSIQNRLTSYEVRPARRVSQPDPDSGTRRQAGVKAALDGGDVGQADGLPMGNGGLCASLRAVGAPRRSKGFTI
jgi:hypothetical protein